MESTASYRQPNVWNEFLVSIFTGFDFGSTSLLFRRWILATKNSIVETDKWVEWCHCFLLCAESVSLCLCEFSNWWYYVTLSILFVLQILTDALRRSAISMKIPVASVSNLTLFGGKRQEAASIFSCSHLLLSLPVTYRCEEPCSFNLWVVCLLIIDKLIFKELDSGLTKSSMHITSKIPQV